MIRIAALVGFANEMLFSDENEDNPDTAPSTSISAAAQSTPLLDEDVEPGPSGTTRGACVEDDTTSGEAV